MNGQYTYVITGVIFIVIGLGICIIGYNKTQPTGAEKAHLLIEQLSGHPVPAEFKSDRTEGYLFMGGGGIIFLIGTGLILKSSYKL